MDQTSIETSAVREWNSSKTLQNEFPTAATYAAFKKAEARGEVKILGKQAVKGATNHV